MPTPSTYASLDAQLPPGVSRIDRAMWRAAVNILNQDPRKRIRSLAGVAVVGLAGAAVISGLLLLTVVAIASGTAGLNPFGVRHVFLLASMTVGVLVIVSLQVHTSLMDIGRFMAAGRTPPATTHALNR